MPLSEEEQRLLEQMEQALSTEDPKFASTLRGSALRARSRRRAALAAAGFLAGVAILMTGAVVKETVVAVIGFLAMLAAAYVFVSQWRRSTGNVRTSTSLEVSGGISENRRRVLPCGS